MLVYSRTLPEADSLAGEPLLRATLAIVQVSIEQFKGLRGPHAIYTASVTGCDTLVAGAWYSTQVPSSLVL